MSTKTEMSLHDARLLETRLKQKLLHKYGPMAEAANIMYIDSAIYLDEHAENGTLMPPSITGYKLYLCVLQEMLYLQRFGWTESIPEAWMQVRHVVYAGELNSILGVTALEDFVLPAGM